MIRKIVTVKQMTRGAVLAASLSIPGRCGGLTVSCFGCEVVSGGYIREYSHNLSDSEQIHNQKSLYTWEVDGQFFALAGREGNGSGSSVAGLP